MQDAEAQGEKNFNVRALIATESFLRILRLAAESRFGDLETLAVYLAVVTAGSGRIMRDPQMLAQYADTAILPETLRMGVSRRAIAESLGMPRETARRKIARLIELGAVFEEDGMVKARSPVIRDDRSRALILGVIKEFERVGALLQRHPDG